MGKLFEQIGWGGVIGLVAGVIGMLVGGIAMFAVGFWGVLFYLLFCVGFFWIFWHFMFGTMVMANKLMESGKDGEATIVSMAENGSSMQIGGSLPKPGIRFTLDVRPMDDVPYRATTDMFVSMFELQKYQPGNVVKVKIDPNNKMKLIIAEGTGAMENYSTNAGNPAMMAELKGLVAQQQRLTRDGEQANATITQVNDTNIKINGENPLLELTLEVHPTGGEAFNATTKAPVMASAVHKFAVGKEIIVKFDPKDHSQVVVVHSGT